jgi:hypothetical protein
MKKSFLLLLCGVLSLALFVSSVSWAGRAALRERGPAWVSGTIDQIEYVEERIYIIMDEQEYKIPSADVPITEFVRKGDRYESVERDIYYLSVGKDVSLKVQGNTVHSVEIHDYR